MFEFILTSVLTFIVIKILYGVWKNDSSPFFLDL